MCYIYIFYITHIYIGYMYYNQYIKYLIINRDLDKINKYMMIFRENVNGFLFK